MHALNGYNNCSNQVQSLQHIHLSRGGVEGCLWRAACNKCVPLFPAAWCWVRVFLVTWFVCDTYSSISHSVHSVTFGCRRTHMQAMHSSIHNCTRNAGLGVWQ